MVCSESLFDANLGYTRSRLAIQISLLFFGRLLIVRRQFRAAVANLAYRALDSVGHLLHLGVLLDVGSRQGLLDFVACEQGGRLQFGHLNVVVLSLVHIIVQPFERRDLSVQVVCVLQQGKLACG